MSLYPSCFAFDSKGRIFAGIYDSDPGTDVAGIYVSENEGESWKQISSGPFEIVALVIDSSGQIFSANSSGVSLSTDNGFSWFSVSTGLPLGGVQSLLLAKSGILFAGMGGVDGGVYAFDSNHESWSEKTSGYVQCLAENENGCLLAGTNEGVLLSSDGGNTWNEMNEGLTTLDVRAIMCDSVGTAYAGTWGGGIFRLNPTSGVIENISGNSSGVTLSQNAPNPFNQSTTISFTLPEPSYITLTLYDATGRQVAAIANGFMDVGEHDVQFQRGSIPSGVYFYRLESGGQSATRAMVVEP
jgi:ligand-binding sensor domain-containing protein